MSNEEWGTALRIGQRLESGFTVLDIVELAEMNAQGIWARHDIGTEVFHVLNDDSENLFAFAFATIPQDNTGAAHILEHMALCGSHRYPLKEAFMVLAQGSLQTFLNAWTFPDKTVYPASSVNEHDYFNLMSVYGDAVFRPLLAEWTFLQEGHRQEFSDAGKLALTGVVYNEMKGAYSSMDTYAHRWSVQAVLPDTPYALESGGDPDNITELTWEMLKDFHRRNYSPANCRIFLAGNIPTEKQLAFFNDTFFSDTSCADSNTASGMPASGTLASVPLAGIPKQKRWDAPKEYRIPCPVSGDAKPTVIISWLLCNTTEINETLALGALTEVLLGHDGSPLMRVLVESGLGEDISPVSGYESDIGETVFAAGLRGVKTDASGALNGAEKKVEALILQTLERLAADGIPKEEIEATLLSVEFGMREIKRSGGPFSLIWMRRALRAWLHGRKPWESMLINPALDWLKGRIAQDSRFFESLIQKYFLDNPHRALVIIEPQEDFLPRKEAQHTQMLAQKERKMDDADRQMIIDKSAELDEMQSREDSPEALASIPHLSRSDLSPEPESIPRRLEDMCGIPVICNELRANGISYYSFAFPLDMLPPEHYPWFSFFSRAATSVGLPGMDYAEVSSLMARTVGGFSAVLHTGTAAPGGSVIATPSGELCLSGRDWIIYRMKCLDEKTAPSLDLALRMIIEADFSDTRRLKDLVLEMKNDIRSSLAPLGHSYASCRAGRLFSPALQTGETWNGLTQLAFVHRLAEMDISEVADKLHSLRDAIISGGLFAGLAGGAGALKTGGSLLAQRFSRFGPPRQQECKNFSLDSSRKDASNLRFATQRDKKELSNNASIFASSRLRVGKKENDPILEVFASPSLQVGFAAASLRAAAFDTVAQVAESVLSHQLSTGKLWESIRMKGGAYGAFASSDSLERIFSLTTYRDPAPLRSLDTFSDIFKAVDFSADDLDKTVIGCYAKETRPQTPAGKAHLDFIRFLSRIDDGCRKRKFKRLISISAQDISCALDGLARQSPAGRVIIAGTKDAEKAAKALGVEPQLLPV